MKGVKLVVVMSVLLAALPLTNLPPPTLAGEAQANDAKSQQKAEFLLVWVFSGDYVDSGLRFGAAGGCYAEAQNRGMEMREIGLNPPQFFCVPLAEGQPFTALRQPQPGSRFPF